MLFVKCLLCMRLFTCSISFNAENCKEEPLYPPFYREGNRLREVKEVTQDHTTKARIQTQATWTHRACTYSPAIVSRRGLGAEGRRKERHRDWGKCHKLRNPFAKGAKAKGGRMEFIWPIQQSQP